MSAELRAQIVELWQTGLSAGVIATQLGLTRNAVMGQVYRAQQKEQSLRRARLPGVPRQKYSRRSRARPSVKQTDEAVEAPLPFVDMGNFAWHSPDGCAWLNGDDKTDPQWCNAPRSSRASPWCRVHDGMAWR